MECAEPGLVDDGLRTKRCQLFDDCVPALATHQQAPQGAHAANRGPRALGTLALHCSEIGQVGAVSLTSMDDGNFGRPSRLQQALHLRNHRAEPAHIDSAATDVPLRVEEIALHVDDEQRHTGCHMLTQTAVRNDTPTAPRKELARAPSAATEP